MPRNVASAVANARPASGVRAAHGAVTAPSSAAGGRTTGISGNRAFDPKHPNFVPRSPQKPSAAAPLPAAAPSPSPMPWDARAQSESGSAQSKYGDAITDIKGDWASREQWYGFGDNGANNPYSQAALLATHHEWGERGVVNGAGNQLYAGSTVNAHRQETNRYTTSYQQLLQSYEAEKAAKTRKEEAAQHERETEEEDAQLGAIERAQETEPEPVAGGGGGGTPQKQGGGKSKKTKDGKKIAIGGAKKA